MTASRTLFFFCISFMVGIGLEFFVKIPQELLWGFLVGGMFLIAAGFFYKKSAVVAGFCLLFLLLGILRLQTSTFTISQDPLRKLNDQPQKITLTGQVVDEPDIRINQQKLKVKVGESMVLVTANLYPPYRYLDIVQITGKLKTPAELANFSYKNYLAKDGVYSVIDYPDITVLPGPRLYTPTTFLYEKILWMKERLVASIYKNFFPPNTLILEGMIFGNDKRMSPELKNQFNATGLSHVTAVSGTNIVILINILMVFLLALGFWRGQAFWAAVGLIWFYLIMIGLPVSGVRAGIMGSMGLLAQKLGRQNTSSRVLTLTGAVMLFQNPMLLVYDVSFQLSFLASLGIIYVKPCLDYYLAVFSWEKTQWLISILSITLAAQIITLPIMVYNFGQVSFIAPITNVLALPVVEALTVLGFLASFAGAFSHLLGFLFSLPCLALLKYFTLVLDIFSKPWAVTTVQGVPWIWIAVYYAALAVLIWWLQKSQNLSFWDD